MTGAPAHCRLPEACFSELTRRRCAFCDSDLPGAPGEEAAFAAAFPPMPGADAEASAPLSWGGGA